MIKKSVVKCETCGKEMERYPSQIKTHMFCSRLCSKAFTSKRMHDFNILENPMNTAEGWTMEKRLAASDREKLNKGPCKKDTYPKRLGRHEHRTIAEQKIGRSLLPGEIVHHRDTDRHNNSAENLMVFKNQREHIEYHLKHPEEPELLKRG